MVLRTLLLTLAVGLLLAPTLSAGDPTTDLKKLQGTWEIVSLVDDGEEVAASAIKEDVVENGRIEFKDKTLTFTRALLREKRQLHFTLGTAGEVSTIEFTTPEKEVKKGIYRFREDTLQLCVSFSPEKDRPDGFASAKGSTALLLTLKRVNP